MRTERVWDGKYDEYGRRREVDIAACSLPMQRIETVDVFGCDTSIVVEVEV